jgi:hypothetical protein
MLHPRSFFHTYVTFLLCNDFLCDSMSYFMLMAVSPLQNFRDSKTEIFVRVQVTQDIILPKGLHGSPHKPFHGRRYKISKSNSHYPVISQRFTEC